MCFRLTCARVRHKRAPFCVAATIGCVSESRDFSIRPRYSLFIREAMHFWMCKARLVFTVDVVFCCSP